MKRRSCNEISLKDVDKYISISGWVNRTRDHGGVIFVDVRDRSGVVQAVFEPERKEVFEKAKRLRSEYVVEIKGIVRKRPEGTENPSLNTGEVELVAEELNILNTSKPLPFSVSENEEINEYVRLKHRYLDLRREKMQKNIILRHRLTKAIRDFLDSEGFLEIETPFLIKSTPEGARDFLVPSRLNPGKFYALPQSPQLFKQILMVSGFEKYFQIARCFRDEDLRADRQPEFTQIDIEISFVEMEDILDLVERMIKYCFENVLKKSLSIPFQKISYSEAMEKYGTDKPDIGFGWELKELTEIFKNSEFKVFRNVLEKNGIIKGLNAKNCGNFSRKELDQLTNSAISYGAKGLVWIAVEEELKSPVVKFFSESEKENLKKALKPEKGDLILIVADEEEVVNSVLSIFRKELPQKIGIKPEREFRFCWVVDFPLFEISKEEKMITSVHHPFTAPFEEDINLLEKEPLKVRAKAYDLVLNGVELGGGSIRIHKKEIQEKIFKILGIPEEEAKEKFGFLLDSLEYGAPPHGGIALGLDRFLMLLLGENSIRDVIPFPKTQSGICLMSGAPYPVKEKQLEELKIKLDITED